MASNSSRGGSSFYNGGATSYRSREGLSTRPSTATDEIQLQIDPMHGDLDNEIVDLHSQVKRLKHIARDIGTEAKSQQDFLEQLQMTLIKAQAGVKNNVRRLNKKIIQNGSNHVVQVVVFALICFFIVYMWSKVSRK